MEGEMEGRREVEKEESREEGVRRKEKEGGQ